MIGPRTSCNKEKNFVNTKLKVFLVQSIYYFNMQEEVETLLEN